MFRLAAIQAAVLDVKLKYLDGWHESRRRNAALYDKLLAGSKVVTPKIDQRQLEHLQPIRGPRAEPGQVKQHLAERKIGSGIYYPLRLHMQDCFAYLGNKEGDLPAERACREVLALPIYPD